jgi:DNA polymerase delta subunit 1
MIERGLMVNGSYLPSETYESSVLYALRFMIDCNIVGCNWIELPAGTYRQRSVKSQLSWCQIEVGLNIVRVNLAQTC